jgi:hypothetical protein
MRIRRLLATGAIGAAALTALVGSAAPAMAHDDDHNCRHDHGQGHHAQDFGGDWRHNNWRHNDWNDDDDWNWGWNGHDDHDGHDGGHDHGNQWHH